ncbi:MAG: 1,4-alpha-glucan branching enzyme GlgB [Chlamydiia bacterium]|nr:1,4-alpha-glucan branching enzyme GlgB [Chlamydiia bacterium]MCH9615978.1 1,4-alpha-glucan branching enzyme GlgB [Chlamydiia bacterium]MCH9628619.1 1,4-alpha-glucan branching enzyme GlgB [Chlamydiia bacterium]
MESYLRENQLDICNPHSFLGVHGGVLRLFRPDVESVLVEVDGKPLEMEKVHDEGVFELKVREDLTPLDYRVYHKNGLVDFDPYAFDQSVPEKDLELFREGRHYEIYKVMGGRLVTHRGVLGARFLVWAPNAETVALVCDSNYWDGRVNPMRRLGDVWELFVPGLLAEEKYKFEMRVSGGHIRMKSDPYALYQEVRPKTASKLFDEDHFEWEDEAWMLDRSMKPMNVYEVHLGSWREGDYRSLALELCDYVLKMGFTHVEVMPISEYPLDESWGYQVSGYYAVTSRYGTPEDFQFFVNHMHKNGIGVILDWVPAHFPSDDFSFARFDGTCLYEHEDPRQGYHPHWNTMIFNYGRFEVSNFLLGSALFYLDKMHIDGLRVDAVASMLYLDYGREGGDFIPNKFGGNENLEAIEFLKQLNTVVHGRFKGVMTIAEDSSQFGSISKPIGEGGLGFTHRWNMGWMNDMIHFFPTNYPYREKVQHYLVDASRYAFHETFVSPLSHDEVVHEKRSLLMKMPGSMEEKFANMRLMFGWMYSFPGDQLLFMGGEFGQETEWNCKGLLPWELLDQPLNRGLQACVKDLNRLFLEREEFGAREFEWVHESSCQIVYKRGRLMCYVNPTLDELEHEVKGNVLFNSDDKKYGGRGQSRPNLATVITEL